MSPNTTPTRTPARVAAAAATAALLAGSLAACSHGDKKPESGGTPTQPPATAPPLGVTITRVAGTLKKPAQAKVTDAVRTVLQEYVDDAFLGDYPRSDFSDAFSSFTPGAAKKAEKHAGLLSGSAYQDSTSVTATTLAANLTVFSPLGVPAGVTARVHFDLDFDGKPVTFVGRLLLTKEKGAWRIFGYDLRRNDQPSGASQ